MTTTSPAVSEEEVARVVALEDELHRTLPDIDDDTIDQCVDHAWAHFSDARVRDFVPLLVRRQVMVSLGPHRAVVPESIGTDEQLPSG